MIHVTLNTGHVVEQSLADISEAAANFLRQWTDKSSAGPWKAAAKTVKTLWLVIAPQAPILPK